MAVTEFVPQILLAQRLSIRDSQMLATGERLEHREVRRARFVQSRQQRDAPAGNLSVSPGWAS